MEFHFHFTVFGLTLSHPQIAFSSRGGGSESRGGKESRGEKKWGRILEKNGGGASKTWCFLTFLTCENGILTIQEWDLSKLGSSMTRRAVTWIIRKPYYLVLETSPEMFIMVCPWFFPYVPTRFPSVSHMFNLFFPYVFMCVPYLPIFFLIFCL